MERDILTFSIIDSLNKYAGVDSLSILFKTRITGMTVDTSSARVLDKDGNPSEIEFCDTVDALFYMGKANNVNYGLTLKEGKIIFYQKINGKWVKTDSADFFEKINVNKMDVNGDGYKDLRISTIYDKNNGDLLTCVFLFDRRLKMFKHNRSFGQANIEYDSLNKFVRFWMGCNKGRSGVKWRGLVCGEILEVDSTVTFGINTNKETGNKIGILELFKGSNGASYKPLKTLSGDPDSLWLLFSITFWNSSK